MKTEFFWDEVGAGIPTDTAHILLWRLHLAVNKKQREKNSIGIMGDVGGLGEGETGAGLTGCRIPGSVQG